MKSEILGVLLILIVGLVIYYGNVYGLRRLTPQKKPATNIYEIVMEAKERGRSSGVVQFPEGSCIDDFIPTVEVPCREEGGIFAEELYCFGNGYYEVNATKNAAGGVCIRVEKVI